MKVVINRCFGGFGLSQEAYKWLIKNKGWTITEYTDDGYGYKDPEAKLVQVKSPVSRGDYYLVGNEEEQSFRSDPNVIECVETLGEEANDACANLQIVEIPDDLDGNWEIGEYDGTEWVQEVHRRWS